MKKIIVITLITLSVITTYAQQGLEMGNRFYNQNFLLMNGSVTTLNRAEIIYYCQVNGFSLPAQPADETVLLLYNMSTGQVSVFKRRASGAWRC